MSILGVLNAAGGATLKMYNITFKRDDTRTVLDPCIPYTAAEDEDQTTERVCFSDSVEGCIAAIGSCSRDLHIGGIIVVRSVSILDIDAAKLIKPKELFDSGKVPDAIETGEHWYLGSVNITREEYEIKYFLYEYCLSFSCIKCEDIARIAADYVDTLMYRGLSSKDIYDNVCGALDSMKMYDKCDEFYDRVAALPWAQRIKISQLMLSKL